MRSGLGDDRQVYDQALWLESVTRPLIRNSFETRCFLLPPAPPTPLQLFTVHIMGYSLADTALVALISRYASPATQGRSLGLNQAAQSMARVVSPVVRRRDAVGMRDKRGSDGVLVVFQSCIARRLWQSTSSLPIRADFWPRRKEG